MSSNAFNIDLQISKDAKKIVLAGNPNVGKSVIFNWLTGLYVDVSNYPGTTLEINHGMFGNDVVLDTPGVYGISSFNDEETAARDIILDADLVVNVVDAVHLERDLFLTQQIIDTGVPVIMVLNMIDEVERQGLKIDIPLLSQLLNIPIIPTIAVNNKGLKELRDNLYNAKKGIITPVVSRKLRDDEDLHINWGERLLIAEGDEVVAARHNVLPGSDREEIYLARRERINEIIDSVLGESIENASFTARLGLLMIRPITGIPIMLMTFYVMFKLIGVFVAGEVVGFTEETIMQGYYEPLVRGLVAKFISPDSIISYFLTGEYGIMTMTITYVFGLLLPLVVGFYLILSILEDSGYLPRIATLVDRILNYIGLNGRAIIPILLGFGCVTLGAIVTKLLGSDREKRIAIFLLALAIPCSAQLGVITGMLAGLGIPFIALYVWVIFSIMAIVGTLLNMVLPGKSSDLLIDLPPIRMPKLKNILQKTVVKSYQFIKEATPIFACGAFLISLLQVTGGLELIQNIMSPIIVGWLKLPKETATIFVMGIIRRDFGVAGLTALSLTSMQMLIALVTLTLFVPCIAAMLVLFKERGKKEAPIIWFGSWLIAFLTGGIIAQMDAVFDSRGILAVAFLFFLFLILMMLGVTTRKEKLGFLKKTVKGDRI